MTWSPFFTEVTPGPTSTTMPAPSWPRIAGKRPSGSAPDSVNSSVWQMPVALISTITSPAFGPSSCTVVISSGFPAAVATAARTSMARAPVGLAPERSSGSWLSHPFVAYHRAATTARAIEASVGSSAARAPRQRDREDNMRINIIRLVSATALAAGVLAGAAAAADRAPRFSQLKLDQLNDAQKKAAERILKVSSAGLGGPYSMLLRSPTLTKRYLGMTDYLRFETSLPHRLNELAILIDARLWDAQYWWWGHYPIARKAGVPKAVADDIREGRRRTGMKPDEEVVYDVCIELLRDRHLTDATFTRAKAMLGEQQLVDLVAVASFYVMVSSVIIAGEIDVPNGEPRPLPTLLKR